jgi:hypothetical protein
LAIDNLLLILCNADDLDSFSLSIEHGGLFCGMGKNLQYAAGNADWFDHCSIDTFSRLWIDDFLGQLGVVIDSTTFLYWSPTGGLDQGLVCIQSDADILAMTASLQGQERKELYVLVDHSNFLQVARPENIVAWEPPADRDGPGEREPPADDNDPPVERVPVIVREPPLKRRRDGDEGCSSAVTNEEGCDEETDSEFYDSDYDAEDGDDDIFDAHVDKEVNDHNEHQEIVEQEDDAGLENEDIALTSEQKLELKYKFSYFNPEVDINDPQFKIGMIFDSMKELRNALTVYSIRRRVRLKKTRNTAKRINAHCAWEHGCTMFIKAAWDERKKGIVVKKYEPNHVCESVWELKVLTAPFLTEFFIDEFRDNQKMDLSTFATKVQRKFNMCPNRFKLGRARKEALTIIHGDEAEQFRQLRDYGNEMCKRNPGSTFFLTTNHAMDNEDLEPKEHLATLYWSYDACKRGFLKGCRPFICLDGCHIKTKYKGQLLTAVGIDANDCIFPIAFGLVEVECTSLMSLTLLWLQEMLCHSKVELLQHKLEEA